MEVGVLADGRRLKVHLVNGRRSTVVRPNPEEIFEYLFFRMSSSVTDLFDARLSEGY